MFPRLLAVGTRRSFRSIGWLTLSLPREVLAAEMRNSDSDSCKNEAEEENGRIVQDTIRRRLTVCTPCIESVSKLSIGPGSI